MEKTVTKTSVRSLLALTSCLLWGSAFPCVKMGYAWLHIEGEGSQVLFAGYRFFLAGVFTYIIGCIMEKRILTLKKSSVPYIVGQGLLQTTAQYVLFYIGMANTTGTKGSMINASNAFISIIAAHFLMKNDKMTMKKAVGCLIGFAGVIVVNLSPGAWGSGFALKGEGMILLCATAYGLSSVTLKLISDKESPMTITAYQFLIGGAVLIGLGLAMGGSITGFTMKSSLLLIYMALLSTVSFSIWTILLKYNPVGKVAIFGFSIPLFGVLLSGLILGEEILAWKNLAALILECVGIWLVNKTDKEKYK